MAKYLDNINELVELAIPVPNSNMKLPNVLIPKIIKV